MPIKSYLVHPLDGQKENLLQERLEWAQGECKTALNQDIILLVTDTANKAEEELLSEQLQSLSGLKSMALVAGFKTS